MCSQNLTLTIIMKITNTRTMPWQKKKPNKRQTSVNKRSTYESKD